MLFAQILAALVGGYDGIHHSAAEAIFLKDFYTGDRAAAGGADGIFQSAGVLAGLQYHFGSAGQSGRGIFHGFCPR